MATKNPKNWNSTTPTAPSGHVNCEYQADTPDPDPNVVRNASSYLPKMTATTPGAVPTPPNDATKYLDGTGVFSHVPVVTSTVRGLVPDPPNDASKFLDGTGLFSTPGGGSGSSLAQGGRRMTRIFNHDGQALTAGSSHLGDYCQGLGNSAGNENSADSTHGVNDTRYSFGAADTYCGWYGSPGFYRNPRNIDSLFLAFVARTTDIRFWVGLASAGSSLSVSATPSGRYAMFRFSAIDGDSNFQACSSDGSSQTVVDTGIAADMAMHRFGIFFDDVTPGLKFYIDGTLVATITTNLPGAGGLVYVVFANWHTSDSFPSALVGCGGISVDIDM